mgnify:CR=1 FL=1
MKLTSSVRFLLPILLFTLMTLGLEALVRSGILPSYLVPAPSDVWTAATVDSSDLWIAFLDTAWTSALGFTLSALVGLAAGILFSMNDYVRAAFLPYAVFFQTVPIVAIAPLLVIWIGYGAPTVVTSSFIVSIFPILANTLTGFQMTDPNLLDLFRLYKASLWQRIFKLQFPHALPQIFVGFRIGIGLAVIGAVVGEFIAGGGLGGLIDVARTRQRVDVVFAAVLLASLIALLWIGVVNLSARIFFTAHHRTPQNNP